MTRISESRHSTKQHSVLSKRDSKNLPTNSILVPGGNVLENLTRLANSDASEIATRTTNSQLTAQSTSYDSSRHVPTLTSNIHHHYHHVPKEHQKDFSWLDYQYDRKFSAMNKKEESSWADLNDNNTNWWDIKWSFGNFYYVLCQKWDALNLFCLSICGIQASDANIKTYGSHKGVYLQNLKMTKSMKETNYWLIHPFSKLRMIADFISVVIVVFQAFLVPLQIAFYDDSNLTLNQKVQDILTDTWFWLDIALNFHTCHTIDATECLMDPDDIRLHYLTGWFCIDLLSTFPIEIFVVITELPETLLSKDRLTQICGPFIGSFGAEKQLSLQSLTGNNTSSANLSLVKILKIGKLLKIMRLLRITRLIRYVSMWEQFYEDYFDSIQFLIKVTNYLFCMLVIAHISACTQYGMATSPLFENMFDTSWLTNHPRMMEAHTSINDRYWWSMFKAISHMFCIGYGLNPPSNFCDVSITCLSILIGAFAFGWILGTIISTMQDLHGSDRIYTAKYNHVTEYMKYRDIPFDVQERVFLYYEYRFQGKVFDETQVLHELNPVLRKTVIHYNQKWLINSSEMFEDVSEPFKDEIAEVLKFELYLPEDMLFAEGDEASEIYFLARGTISIYVDNDGDSELCGRKIDGELCGEMAIVLPYIDRCCAAVLGFWFDYFD